MRKLLLITLLIALPLSAAELGVWGERGITRSLVLRGNHVLAADGRGLAVYSANGPARLAVARTEEESLDVAVLGSGEAALLTRGALNRYVVADNGTPTLTMTQPLTGYTTLAAGTQYLAAAGLNNVIVWRPESDRLDTMLELQTTRPVKAIEFVNDRLYVAVESEGIYVYSVTAGLNPIAILPEAALDLAGAGNILYVAAGTNGLVTVDVSSPSAPRVLGRVAAGEVNIHKVTVDGMRVYAIEPWQRVRVFDVSSASSPQLLATTIDDLVVTVAASGSKLFLAGSEIDRFGLTNETGIPLRMYDLSGTRPTIAGQVTDYAGPVSGVATDGTFAYVVDPPYFRVLDISTPSQPRELSSIVIPEIQDQVKISGNRAIIYGRGDVDLVDISDPYKPRLLGVYHSLGRPPSTAAFISNAILEANPWSGFHVVDFSQPSNPGQISGIYWHYYEVLGRADSAYIFTINAMRVIDLTDRTNAIVVKEFPLGGAHGTLVEATENHPELLLVTSKDNMLHVFNLVRPLDPTYAVIIPLPPNSTLIAASGDTAYVAGESGVVTTIDLRNPLTETMTTLPMRTLSAMQIAAAGSKVVVADRYAVRVYGERSTPPPGPGSPRRRPTRR